MPKYLVNGVATCSVVAVITADNEAEARENAKDLATPSVHTDHDPNMEDGDWHFNEFDDMADDAIREIEETP